MRYAGLFQNVRAVSHRSQGIEAQQNGRGAIATSQIGPQPFPNDTNHQRNKLGTPHLDPEKQPASSPTVLCRLGVGEAM
jgi:hypothetical protein